jgi:outer membrane protein OmpA-like peptidoglycan-associated protein
LSTNSTTGAPRASGILAVDWDGGGALIVKSARNDLHEPGFSPYYPFCNDPSAMSKLYRLSLAFLLLLPVFSGCQHLQPPSPSDTTTGAGAGVGAGFNTGNGSPEEINPAERTSDIPDDLMQRIRSNTLLPSDILVTVYFDFNMFNIRPADRSALEDAAKTISASGQKVVAVGHTDWYGSDQYNLELSDKRSNTVKDYMAKTGASADQIEILALGKLNCVANVKKDSPEAQHDRRVDVVKIPAGGAPSAAAPAPSNSP